MDSDPDLLRARYDIEAKKGRPEATLDELVPQLQAAARAIEACLGDRYEIRYHVEPNILLVHMPDGRLLGPEQLSAGYRQVLAMVADIARRCVLLNPQLGVDAALETPGIVLIDELELHLHPQWQRLIVAGLRKAFPLIQFICTTHSPQILAEAPPGSVVLLAPGDKVAYPTFTHGRDSNAILQELLGTSARPAAFEVRFDAFREALAAHRIDDARGVLEGLEGELGSEVAEIVEARWSLRAEEALAGDPQAG